jgi:hypothetical protein
MKKLFLIAVTTLLLSGCLDDDSQTTSQGSSGDYYGGAATAEISISPKRMAVAQGMVAPAPAMDEAAISPSAPPSTMVLDRSQMGDRKIAETHNMQIETPYNGLQSRYQRDYKKCVELGCQIMNSNIAMESGGNISARIDPAKLGAFLDFLAEGPGKIQNHSVSADDYSIEYSDTATITKNLAALRDRLSTLLNTRADNVDDILRIEQELNRIQTEIDQHTARLRMLDRMTLMATVNLNYTVEYRPTELKPYELNNTWRNTVNRFMRALDAMIQFIGATLPWIPVLFVGFWLCVRMLRFAVGKITWRWPGRK